MEKKIIHICEVCGKTEIMTPEEAFNDGWDYPPRMGAFGVVSPRTCGDCPIIYTAWWALVSEKKSISELSQKQRETIKRIQGEPESRVCQVNVLDKGYSLKFRGNEREDDLFNLLHEDRFSIGGVKVDINPIMDYKTGTLEEYLPGVEKYLEEKRQKVSIRGKLQEKKSEIHANDEKTDKGYKKKSENVR